MNWRELHQVLVELSLPGTFIREVAQPDAATLLFSLRRPGGIGPARITLLCRLAANSSRLHRTATLFPTHRVPTPRFASFLRAHLRNSRIDSALQLSTERIVRICCDAGPRRRIVWLRLWSGASNCLVTDERGIILDALFRRPQRGEVAGHLFDPASDLTRGRTPPSRAADLEQYQLRPLDGEGDYNARLDAHHRTWEQIQRALRDAQTARVRFESERQRLAIRIARLRASLSDAADYDTLRANGQEILANAHLIENATTQLAAPDGGHAIQLVPEWSPADNARRYFREYRRRRVRAERLRVELATTRGRWDTFRAGGHGPFLEAAAITSMAAPQRLSYTPTSDRGNRHQPSGRVRLAHSAGWVLRVGRSASANDDILRHHTRGNDYWLHCRDHPGAHVFLAGPRDKSPPLAVLLDAATLAVFYSKARGSGKADVHYTQVKNLRSISGGPPGAVLPLREKNLFVRLDRVRLRRLLGAGAPDGNTGPEQTSHSP